MKHPKPKWFFDIFKNNTYFHALKTISRLVGLSSSALIFLTTKNPEWAVIGCALMILLTDIFFFFKGMKESSYKSKKAFRNLATTVKSMDQYNKRLLITKSIFFIILVFMPTSGMIFYGWVCLLAPLVIAPGANYKPLIGNKFRENSIERDIKMFYGIRGFNAAGVFTGNPNDVCP